MGKTIYKTLKFNSLNYQEKDSDKYYEDDWEFVSMVANEQFVFITIKKFV